MEKIEYKNNLYYVVYAVLQDVCRLIMTDDSTKNEKEQPELTVDNILDEVEIEYADCEEQDEAESEEEEYASQAAELFYFLTHEDEKYDKVFENIGEEMNYSFTQDFTLYKHIMMLMIAEATYFEIYYNQMRGIADIDEDLLDLYDEIIDDPESVYTLFAEEENSALVAKLLDYFLDTVFHQQYIKDTISLEAVKKEGKLSKILKMNPLSCLVYLLAFSVDDLTESEKTIQNFIDAYEYAISYSDELDDDDRMNLLLDKVEDYYKHDKKKTDAGIAYVLANVYENCKLYPADAKCQELASLIEDNSEDLEALIETFRSDCDLFWVIMDHFYGFTNMLDQDDLPLLRWKFKTGKGNVKVLKKLNPFYEEEERVFGTEETT